MVRFGDFDLELLEIRAVELLADPDLTPIQKRRAFFRLLTRFYVLQDYLRGLEAFIRRMMQEAQRLPVPEDILMDMLESPEFAALKSAVLAALIAVTYSAGPRAAWVPSLLIPSVDEVVTGRYANLLEAADATGLNTLQGRYAPLSRCLRQP